MLRFLEAKKREMVFYIFSNCVLAFAVGKRISFIGAYNLCLFSVSCSPMIGVICMAYSMLVTVIVSLCTKPPKQEVLDGAFGTQAEESVTE